MRIFTLGKNGIPLFYFALILFSGTFSTYGQNCPTVAETTQTFCGSEDAEIGDLAVTGDDIVWYSDSSLSTELPATHLLADGETYYANHADKSCSTVSVTVQITVMPEILGIKEDTSSSSTFSLLAQKQSASLIGLCVDDVDSPGVFVRDLRTSADNTVGSSIQWYFGSDEATAIAVGPNVELQSGTYWVEQVVTTEDGTTCTTARNRTVIELFSEVAPTGPPAQTFCAADIPTLLDIEASGENRYYSSATSEVRLSENTELVDGTTYYVSTLGELCESSERLAVTVTLGTAVVVEETQSFCGSLGSGNDFRKPMISDLLPSGTWYSDEALTTTVPVDTEIETGDVYYTPTADANCSVTKVNVEILPTPNAGSTTEIIVCQSAASFELLSRMESSHLDIPLSTNGTWDPALSTGSGSDAEFNPADYEPGTYTFRYRVPAAGTCDADFAVMRVTVQEAPPLVENPSIALCQAELDAIVDQVTADPSQAQAIFVELFGNLVPVDGTFSVSPTQIAMQYVQDVQAGNLPQTYTTDYTLTDPVTNCSSTSSLSVTVNPTPNAGVSTNIQLVEGSTDIIDLFAALGDDAEENGTWSSGNGSFNPSTDTPGAFTYTVTNSTGCSASATVTVLTVQQDCPIVTEAEQDFCNSIGSGDNYDRPRVRNLEPSDAVWYASADATEPLESTTLLVDGAVYYAGTAAGDCTERPTVTVVLFDAPNAGGTASVTFCASADPVNLVDYMGDSQVGPPQYTGSFNNPLIVDNIFNPADFAVGKHTFTYTVLGNEDCPTDTARITVTITDENLQANAGGNIEDTVCSTAGVLDLNDFLGVDAILGGSFSAPYEDGTFNPATAETDSVVITYTVNGDVNCVTGEDSATITLNVIPGPDAGEDGSLTLATTEAPVNLYDSLGGTPDEGGTWAPGNATGDLDPSEFVAGNYSFTYTVTSDNGCEDTAVVSVTITGEVTCPEVPLTEQSFCESTTSGNDSVQPTIADLLPTGATWYASTDATEALAANTVLIDGTTYYAGNANGTCETREGVTVTLEDSPNAGVDVNENFCVRSADELPTAVEFMAAYQDDDRDQNGTFSPTLNELAIVFAANPFGTFSTTYSVSNGNCTDTAELSVTINEALPANAGGNVEHTVCSTAGVLDLNDYLGEDAILGGVFSAPYENGTFDPATAETNTVEVTYTVNGEVACATGEDSATITFTVIPGPDAGEDGSLTLAVTASPVNLFDSLGGTPDEGGTWNPGNANGNLDPSEFVAGNYSFTYTVTSDNGCEDTAVVSVTITGEVSCPEVTLTEQSFCESILSENGSKLPAVTDLLPTGATWYASADATEALAATTILVDGATYFAGNSNGTCEARVGVTVTLEDSPNAGATTTLTFCEGGDAVDLLTLINPSILGAPDAGGTFSPALTSGTTVFDPAVDKAGTYIYTVKSNEVCPADEARIRINITPSTTAGEDFSLEFCADAGPQDLFTLLPEGVSTDGTFADLTDGIFDPAVNAAGDYTYTVEQTGDCEGTSTATVSISISEVPEAPSAAAQSFCISEAATVADLTATGEMLQWYTDAETENLADETAALVAGTYYVTSTSEGGCESAVTAVEVSLTDAATPTLATDGHIFCEFDNPTIADLQANVQGSGTITWYDAASGGNVLSGSDLLTNGTTYYAAATDATSACESSVRLAVTVDLSECPVVIPDAFSPNGDGVNDTFEITYIGDEFPNFTIEIYNRWGNIVFKGNASTSSWDGVSTESRTLGSKVLPVGVYFYIVNFNDGQTPPTQGRLYLSR